MPEIQCSNPREASKEDIVAYFRDFIGRQIARLVFIHRLS